MKKVIQWIEESHRWLHLLLGMAFGIFANGLYCAIYGGVGVAGALEFKDGQWGGKPDVIDFVLTFAGTLAGYGIRAFVLKLIWLWS